MRRLFVAVICGCFVLSMAACGDDDEPSFDETQGEVNGHAWGFGGGSAVDVDDGQPEMGGNSGGEVGGDQQITVTLTDRSVDACDGGEGVGRHISVIVPAEEGTHSAGYSFMDIRGPLDMDMAAGQIGEVEITEVTSTSISGEFKVHSQDDDNFIDDDVSFTVDRCQD